LGSSLRNCLILLCFTPNVVAFATFEVKKSPVGFEFGIKNTRSEPPAPTSASRPESETGHNGGAPRAPGLAHPPVDAMRVRGHAIGTTKGRER